VALVAAMILDAGGTDTRVYLPCYAILYLALIASVAAGWTRIGEPPWRSIDTACCGLLLLPLVQIAARRTSDPALTEQAFLHIAAATAVYWMVRRLLRTRHPLPLGHWFAVFCGALSVEAIFQRVLTPHYIFGLILKDYALPMGPFVNRDDFAACVELLFPFALLLALSAHRKGRWIYILSACAAMAAVAMSASRGGAIGIGFELALGSWLAWRRHGSTGISFWTWTRRGLLPILAVGAAATAAVGIGAMLGRLPSVDVALALRLKFYEAGSAIARSHPLWGTGLGTWIAVYPRYARIDNGKILEFAHSDYVQWAAEAGLLGAGAVAGLIASAVRTCRRCGSPLGPDALAALLGLAAFSFHALFDFPFHIPSLLLLFAAVAGTCCADRGFRAVVS